MQAMNCRAVGIARQDLAGGINLLKQISAEQKLNWLSLNLVDAQTKQPIFTPVIHARVGSTRIAVLGLTDEQAVRADTRDYTILPWQTRLADVLAKAEKNADMIILLSSYPESINKEIARTMPAIDLILESGHTTSNLPPKQIRNTLLTRVGARGKYVGMMRIHWTRTGHWGKNIAGKIRDEQQQLDRINWQIGRLQKRFEKNALNNHERYKNLLAAREQSEHKIELLKKIPAEETDQPCSYTNHFYALRSSLPQDRKIQAIIDQTTREINERNRRRLSNTGKKRSAALTALAGGQKCRKCHTRQYAYWQSTDHAHAWQTLVDRNDQFNENCLICHVTLPYYDPARIQSAQLLVDLPASLHNVGCESCHGPGADHSSQPKSVRPLQPDKKICIQCHTPDHDDNFIFVDKIDKVRCPKG